MEVTVVHLARRANGLDPVRRFVDSYLRHGPGIPHALRVIGKGFPQAEEIRAELGRLGRPFEIDLVADTGVDIGAYLTGAARVTTAFACFLNSHSEIRADGWLAKLMAAVRTPGVGVAAATGSYESTSTALVEQTRRELDVLLRSPRTLAKRAAVLAQMGLRFPRHPNAHVRSNAFAIRTDLFRTLHLRGADKLAALEFESGRASMTRQLRKRGLEAVVVGADGRTFSSAAWPESATFRYLDQPNLLVHDNQTRRYQQGGAEEQQMLGRLAWGLRFRAA